MKATLDKQPIPYWKAVLVKAGSTLRLGSIQGNGFRTYINVQGGFDVPDYLGSKATFTLGDLVDMAAESYRWAMSSNCIPPHLKNRNLLLPN